MKLREAKKLCKRCIRSFHPPLEIVKTIKHLYIVKARPNFICMRWYAFTVSAENNPRLSELIAEQE